jgi:hypothetical protein
LLTPGYNEDVNKRYLNPLQKGNYKMFTRREYESYFGKVTDEEWKNIWKNIQKSIDEAMDKIYEEDHPLDD